MYRFSFKQYMRISPDSPRKATHITFGKIHSTDKSNTSVNHHNLPVIAIIHFTREQGKTDLQKLRTSIPASLISSKSDEEHANILHRHRSHAPRLPPALSRSVHHVPIVPQDHPQRCNIPYEYEASPLQLSQQSL